MNNVPPPSAAIYDPAAMGARIALNTLLELIYNAHGGLRRKERKSLARDLELLAVELADNGADDETLATMWETAARLRHTKHLAEVEAERRADRVKYGQAPKLVA